MPVVPSSNSRPWRLGALAWAVLIVTGVAGALMQQPSAAPPKRTAPISLDGPWLGFALNCHHISDLDLYLESVDAIADLGANALIVVTPWFQTRIDSTEIGYIPRRCPTEEQLLAIFDRAKRHGLRTALMPIVLLEQAGDDDWRGVIQPTDWNAWWRSFEAFNAHFLDFASRAKIDLYFVGSELNSTELEVSRWQRVIQQARERFDGKLAYSANWDRFDKVSFWRMVDYTAVSSYFELEEPGKPRSVEELTDTWRGIRDRLLAQAAKYDRPLLLSEIGYPSLTTGAAYPWDYTDRSGGAFDPNTQARAWKAFLAAWKDAIPTDDRTAGFFGYRWDPYHRGGRDDTGYGVRGKPAHDVLRDAFTHWRDALNTVDPDAGD